MHQDVCLKCCQSKQPLTLNGDGIHSERENSNKHNARFKINQMCFAGIIVFKILTKLGSLSGICGNVI